MDQKIKSLSRHDVQLFVRQHPDVDEKSLVLKNRKILGLPSSWIAEQIAGRRKIKEKLPTFYQTHGIVYPSTLAMEQASSEMTASYKAAFLKACLQMGSRKIKGADLTGGLGVDTFFFSGECNALDYVEPSHDLLDIARHNHHALGAVNMRYHHQSAQDFLHASSEKFDFIFIDPARRNKANKVFKLSESQPPVTELIPAIFTKTNVLLLKASPMLDLRQGNRELSGVQKIVVLAVDNECRELLFYCEKNSQTGPVISCVNLSSQGSDKTEFVFSFPEETGATSVFSKPLRYLYEPNASILKAGAFKLVGSRFAISKIHANTHLYTSENQVDNFPGRVFKIEAINPDARERRALFPDNKANIIVRNYPSKPEQLGKTLKLTDGGDRYLLGFSGGSEKFLVAAHRIK